MQKLNFALMVAFVHINGAFGELAKLMNIERIFNTFSTDWQTVYDFSLINQLRNKLRNCLGECLLDIFMRILSYLVESSINLDLSKYQRKKREK